MPVNLGNLLRCEGYLFSGTRCRCRSALGSAIRFQASALQVSAGCSLYGCLSTIITSGQTITTSGQTITTSGQKITSRRRRGQRVCIYICV